MRITIYDTRVTENFETVLVKERAVNYKIEVLDTPQKVVNMMNQIFDLQDRGEELCYMIAFNSKNKVIGVFLVSKGSVNRSFIGVREIYVRALLCGASGIILIHNHPSKDITPSTTDLKSTNKIAEAGKLIGVELLDHIIIGGLDFYSCKSEDTY